MQFAHVHSAVSCWHRGEGLCLTQSSTHSCGTGLLWDTDISKVLLGTLSTTLTGASQGSCDLDTTWYLKLQQIAVNNN